MEVLKNTNLALMFLEDGGQRTALDADKHGRTQKDNSRPCSSALVRVPLSAA
jgi:hypothetical protein